MVKTLREDSGRTVEKPPTIIIADRNTRIRKFLQREITAAGYVVIPADTADQLIALAYGKDPVDLVILDPDLPDVDFPALFRKICNRIPQLPVVFHSYDRSETGDLLLDNPSFFVQKKGDSLKGLMKMVHQILGPGQPKDDKRRESGKKGKKAATISKRNVSQTPGLRLPSGSVIPGSDSGNRQQ